MPRPYIMSSSTMGQSCDVAIRSGGFQTRCYMVSTLVSGDRARIAASFCLPQQPQARTRSPSGILPRCQGQTPTVRSRR